MSDTHLESYPMSAKNFTRFAPKFSTAPETDVLILAGDISDPFGYQHFPNVDWFTQEKPVIWVPGNHEYYDGNINTTVKSLREKFMDKPNVHILDRDFIIIDRVMFIGVTLWANVGTPLDQQNAFRMADFTYIKGMTKTNDMWLRYLDDVEYLRGALKMAYEERGQMGIDKVVVVTHHVPTRQDMPSQYKFDSLSAFFYNNLDQLMYDENIAPCLWIHGHDHVTRDHTYGNTRVVSNACGYFRSPNLDYKPGWVVEV